MEATTRDGGGDATMLDSAMEDPVVISLDESFEECPKNAQFVLVGKILASKTLNRVAVQKILERAWRTEQEFTISYWQDNVYGFSFQNEDDLCRIISKGPWSIMGSILILRKWDQSKSFSDLDFVFSPFWVQIHADFAVVDTIQYGDKPLPKLIYPEGRRSVEEDGGACSGTGEERVANPSGNIPSSDPKARQNRGIVERIMVCTNSLESDTSRVGINEAENLSSGMPTETQLIKCGSVGHKSGFDGPSSGLSKGGEEFRTGPVYYVEEPDSPRPISDVEKAKSPVELQIEPTSFFGNSFSVNLSKVGQCPRTGEEGIVSAFNKALNLKRKGVEELERDQGKRLKESGSVEASKQDFALVRLSAEEKGSSCSPHRGCLGRGRGRRGGRAGRSTIRGWNQIPALCDVDLVEVEVRAGVSGVELDPLRLLGFGQNIRQILVQNSVDFELRIEAELEVSVFFVPGRGAHSEALAGIDLGAQVHLGGIIHLVAAQVVVKLVHYDRDPVPGRCDPVPGRRDEVVEGRFEEGSHGVW
ncbi:hypothetical protein C3L33_13247, partial [Rhododendron williamsianum]